MLWPGKMGMLNKKIADKKTRGRLLERAKASEF